MYQISVSVFLTNFFVRLPSKVGQIVEEIRNLPIINTIFNRYLDGQMGNTVELNDTNLVYPLASVQEVFDTNLANVISQRYAPKDWR